MGTKAYKSTILMVQLPEAIKRYSMVIQRDVSTEQAHIYFSKPLKKFVTAIRKGESAILTFTDECPCGRVFAGKTPW